MWYRPDNKEEARQLGKAGYRSPRFGFFLARSQFARFTEEAERVHPEHTRAQNRAWAAHSARTHPSGKRARRNWMWIAIAGVVLIVMFLAAMAARAEPPPDHNVVPTDAILKAIRVHPGVLAQFGSPVVSRIQVRDNTGAWQDVGLFSPAISLPVQCTSGCSGGGGANAAAGLTGSAVPTSADYEGFNSGGNLVGVSAANPLPVSAAALPLPSGAATSANQTNGTQTTQVSNFPAIQPVSGTVTVSNPSSGGTIAAPSVVTPINPGAPASINVTNTPFHPVPVSISNPAQLASLINGNCNASTVPAHTYCGNNSSSSQAPSFVVPNFSDGGGNVALKRASGDHTQYVSTSGSDSNDGLSWGTAKLTPLAAINTATNVGTNGGLVYVACGTYPGPTGASLTYFHVSIISMCAETMQDFAQIGGTAIAAQTVFSYTAGLSLAPVDQRIIGISFDFQALGGGITFTNGTFLVDWSYVNIHECGNTTTPCLLFQTTGSTGGASNIAVNSFDHLRIKPNTTVSQNADCIVISGSGPVNAGTFATDMVFSTGNCSGNIRNGIRSELNSDTNYFRDFQFGQQLAVPIANTAALAFNTLTPATDQDADGSMYDGISYTGALSVYIRAGQSNGNWIKASAGGTPSVVVLGGNPQMSVQVIGLAGVQSNFWTNGTFSALANANLALPAMVPGDMAVARTATSGVLYLGNDGGQILRNGVALSLLGAGSNTGLAFSIPEGALATATAGNETFWADNVEHNWNGVFNNDGIYRRWPFRQLMASSSGAVTSTTLGQPGGMTAWTWNVAAGRTYSLSCDGYYQISSVTGVPSPAFAIAGTATQTAMWMAADGYQTAALTTAGAVVTAVATKSTLVTTASTPVATNLPFHITGAFNINAGGTLLVQASNSLNAGASVTIGTLSSCTLQ